LGSNNRYRAARARIEHRATPHDVSAQPTLKESIRPVAADRIWQKLTPKEAMLYVFNSPRARLKNMRAGNWWRVFSTKPVAY
jgi:hypothetical protein